MGDPRAEREAKVLSEAKTPEQRETVERLQAQDVSVYLDNRKGSGVVRAFERYLRTADPEKITPALRDYLMMRESGFIAHYDLHGFRRVYADPANMLRDLGYSWGGFQPTHSQYAYTDGMTSVEVRIQMQALVRDLMDEVLTRSSDANRERELAAARELAARHGFELAEVNA